MKNLLFIFIFIVGCKFDKPKIEPGDKVIKCTIDSMSVKMPASVAEYEPKYYYYTDCGQPIISNRNDLYKIGDTIMYVYKKIK